HERPREPRGLFLSRMPRWLMPTARDAVLEIAFVGRGSRRRKRHRAAGLALHGATSADLKSALALAEVFDAEALLVAVDGGLSACRAMRRRPDLFVGDLD